jgi:hypothetical protein
MVSASRRTYERKVVVCILELGIIGVDLINKEWNCFAVFVAFDRPTCSAIISTELLDVQDRSFADIPGM